jgi:hypothetical protein
MQLLGWQVSGGRTGGPIKVRLYLDDSHLGCPPKTMRIPYAQRRIADPLKLGVQSLAFFAILRSRMRMWRNW